MKKKNNDEEPVKKAKIEDKNGLNIAYDRNQFENNFPNLITEITDKKKSVKIDSVNLEFEQPGEGKDQSKNRCVPKELINPEATDFLRRCSTKEEAIEILDYLLNRKELTVHEYEEYKKRISQKGGLENLIEESGGFKKSGYYERKYYKKDFLHQKFKRNKK